MKIFRSNRISVLISLGVGIAIGTASLSPVYAEESNQEISEIGWSSRLSSMGLDTKDNTNQKYRFNCQSAPKDLVHAPIWGTKVYTTNSGICSAAVHAGVVDPEKGGIVTIELIEGRKFYTGSDRNKVKSQDRASANLSFVFIDRAIINEDNSERKFNEKKQNPSVLEKILMDGLTRGVERTIDKAITDILK